MYKNVDPKRIAFTVRSMHIIPASFLFGIATLCRSTGIIMAFFVFVNLVKKLIVKSDRFFKIYKYVFYFFCTFVIMIMPLGVVMLWKPFVMHCETKLDRTNAVPLWCLNEFPNVYGYVQKVYW